MCIGCIVVIVYLYIFWIYYLPSKKLDTISATAVVCTPEPEKVTQLYRNVIRSTYVVKSLVLQKAVRKCHSILPFSAPNISCNKINLFNEMR